MIFHGVGIVPLRRWHEADPIDAAVLGIAETIHLPPPCCHRLPETAMQSGTGTGLSGGWAVTRALIQTKSNTSRLWEDWGKDALQQGGTIPARNRRTAMTASGANTRPLFKGLLFCQILAACRAASMV